MNIDDLYTGVKTQNGEKVYLGDRIKGEFFYPFVVQYDFQHGQFILTTTGRDKSPYRSYRVQDIPELPGLRVVSNQLIYAQATVGEKVRITVKNVKDAVFVLGEIIKIVAVNEWDVMAESLDGQRMATLQYHDFLPLWRWDD